MFYMEKLQNSWTHWGERLRQHVKESHRKWSDIAETMDLSEGSLRHWCNGTRDINLKDFFRLCESTGADAHLILFGKPNLHHDAAHDINPELVDLITQDAAINPRYPAHSQRLRQAVHHAKQPSGAKRYKKSSATKR